MRDLETAAREKLTEEERENPFDFPFFEEGGEEEGGECCWCCFCWGEVEVGEIDEREE